MTGIANETSTICLFVPQSAELRITNLLALTVTIPLPELIRSCCCYRFSHIRLCATPLMAAHQSPPSLGFSRQEHWSGFPFPSSIHESEKWKWSHLVYMTLCNPKDCNTPGLPVCQQLLEFTQTYVHWVSDSIQPSYLLSSPSPPSFNLSQHLSQLFASNGQSIGVSALSSVLSMNIQDWFPLGWTGWISLQSKGLSRVFSNTTVEKH